MPSGDRLRAIRRAYAALTGYTPVNAARPVAYFGVIVEKTYPDHSERAYEELLHRFDEMLTRLRNAGDQQRGLVIHDKASTERTVQDLTHRWRTAAGRIGTLERFSDVPMFADSKSTRLLQAADLVSFSLWRYFGPPGDDRYIRMTEQGFDQSAGVLHGMVHVHRAFARHECGCPGCLSRRPAA